MEDIFLGQDFSIDLKINEDLTDATNLVLNVRHSSNRVVKQLPLQVSDAAKGEVFFLSIAKELDRVGQWRCWPTYTTSTGLDRFGKGFNILILTPGE
jgi:hypothetical protein